MKETIKQEFKRRYPNMDKADINYHLNNCLRGKIGKVLSKLMKNNPDSITGWTSDIEGDGNIIFTVLRS